MRRALIALLALMLGYAPAIAADDVRFAALDIVVDSRAPFAAWQAELDDDTGNLVIVGVENGDSAAFDKPPYYDLAAVDSGIADRLILASYSLAAIDDLPQGPTRVATVHVMIRGDIDPQLHLKIVAGPDGETVDANARIEYDKGETDD